MKSQISNFKFLAGRRFVLSALLLLSPSLAQAHLMNTGLGPVYDGLTHLFITPEDLLPVIALSLLAGLRGPRYGRASLFILPVTWLIGAIAGLLLAPHFSIPVALAALTFLLGALAAADLPLPMSAIIALAAMLGILHGLLNGLDLGRGPQAGLAVVGLIVSLFVTVALLSGQAAAVRAKWARTAMRVAGSWIAAAGLLMIGWAIRTR